MTTIHQYEVALFVEDYNDDFDACMADTQAAKAIFEAEADEYDINVIKIHSVEFVEFDSPNPSHAGGIFNVKYEGDPFPEDA